MPRMPTAEDVRHVRAEAQSTIMSTVEAVKSPFFAALGAVDVATQTALDAFSKVRTEATERADEAQSRLQQTLHELQARVAELPHEVAQLRHRLEPAELRRTAEQYRAATQRAYTSLTERGAEVFGEFRSQPRVAHALESVEAGVDTTQERLEAAVRELNVVVEELLARFARTSRSVGEKTARRAEGAGVTASEQIKETAQDVAETVRQAGRETAATTRSVSRKAAERTSPSGKPASRRSGDHGGHPSRKP